MIILIPSALLGTLIYKQFYDIMMNEYINQKQQIINEYYFNMEKDLARIQDIYSLFQCNTNLIDYLDGKYNSDMDSIYTFSKYIKQVYGYVYSSLPVIKDINIYKNNENILDIPPQILNIDTFENANFIQSRLTPVKGVWNCQQANKDSLPEIKYYIKVYNNDFDKELGILEILPNSQIMSNYLNNIKSISMGNDGIYLLDMNDEVLYKTGNKIAQGNEEILDKLLHYKGSNGYFNLKLEGKKVIGNVIYIKALNIKTIVLEDETDALKYLKVKKSTIWLYVIILFLVLSTIYYFIATNITTRVLKLAKHMRTVNERNISVYTGKRGKDEIGFLIDSYNSMILRIDELVNTVHKEELLRKEAAYAALQAQIRPHFLFGTLESIRMLAESNKDFEVSNIIFTFGRLMRYSLSSSKNEVFLKEELENVKRYLEIQKMRIGERLQYEFHIESEIGLFLCPQFILQPLVENSVVHGIFKCRDRGFINISVTSNQQYVIITIFDDGLGISAEELLVINNLLDNKIDIKDFQTENSGFGVYSVSERIKAYYGKDSRLILTSTLNEGTTCTLYLYRNKGEVNNEDNDRR
jgi:two-component system sensor histidine kinase YesM